MTFLQHFLDIVHILHLLFLLQNPQQKDTTREKCSFFCIDQNHVFSSRTDVSVSEANEVAVLMLNMKEKLQEIHFCPLQKGQP